MNEQLLGALIAFGSAFLGAALALYVNHRTSKSQIKMAARAAWSLLTINVESFVHSWNIIMQHAKENHHSFARVVVNVPFQIVSIISKYSVDRGKEALEAMNCINNYHNMCNAVEGAEPNWNWFNKKITIIDGYYTKLFKKILETSI
ncbi:hypothetical protein K8R78_04845 [bacterium]|nr:hypothetical protein [bacterium]